MDDNDNEALRDAPPARLDVDVVRTLPAQVELRAEGDEDADGEDGSPGTMVGHFSTFNEWYEINSYFEGHFIERIAPGAFKRTLKNRSGETPIRVLLEHGFDPQVGDKPLGVPRTLEERDSGAYAEVPLFDTSYNRDLAPALRAGAYGQSFRFQVLRDGWVEPDGKGHEDVSSINAGWANLPQRTIAEVRVAEFGPTVFPANPGSDAALRCGTDEFYEQLRRRDPESADKALARCAELRTPEPPQAATPPADAPPADPPTGHAKEPAATRSTSDAPPVAEHSAADSTTPPDKTRSTTMDEPMTVEERTARQSEIRARFSEIDTEYAGAALPEEVQQEWDSLRTEYDGHDTAIEAQVRRREELANIAARSDSGTTGSTGTGTGTERARTAPGTTRRPTDIYDLSALRQQARSVDDLPALYREGALRAIEVARYPGTDRAAAQTQAEHLLDTVDDKDGSLARRILVTGSPVYERAFGKAAMSGSTMGLTAEEQRALSLGTTTEGGFAVPFQLDPTVILTSGGVINPLRAISRVVQITGKEWQGITSAGITVSRADEADEATDDAPTLGQPTVKAERVQGFVPFSMEIEQDWSGLRSEMTMMLQDAKDTEESASFITGNGTPPAANGLIGTLGAGANVVANTFGVANLYALEEALAPRFRARARVLANKAVYNLVRQFDTAGGANLWVRLTDGQPPELIGYSAHEASSMVASVSTIGDRFLLMGDFSNFLIVDRIGMSVELLPHLLGANRRPTGQRGIYAVWRNNSKILNDGAFKVLHKAA